MSKIGRKPIDIKGVDVKINGQVVSIKGPNLAAEHELPYFLSAKLEGDSIKLGFKDNVSKKFQKEYNSFWGLHRALIANKISGAKKNFERRLRITGLGFKAQQMGSKLQFTLGYTNKIDINLPTDIKVEIDKTGQILDFKSPHKDSLGHFCDTIRSFRPTEPYKGTGIKFEEEVVFRKAGKAKS